MNMIFINTDTTRSLVWKLERPYFWHMSLGPEGITAVGSKLLAAEADQLVVVSPPSLTVNGPCSPPDVCDASTR
jgi:hypothetical protein